MIVYCEITNTTIENDRGIDVDSVCATCNRCGHETESYGQSSASRTRCLVLMREECPRNEENFYKDADDE